MQEDSSQVLLEVLVICPAIELQRPSRAGLCGHGTGMVQGGSPRLCGPSAQERGKRLSFLLVCQVEVVLP